jgi:hypothetical protein
MRHARPDYNRIQDPAGKIAADEPVFLLRANDMLASGPVRYYAAIAKDSGLDDIAKMAYEWADRMDDWRERNGKGKLPDIPR